MSHFLDHAGPGHTGGIAHAVQHLPSDSERFAQTDHPAIAMSRRRNVRSPYEVGHPVDARDVPDFWKPIEEWTVD
jgi:hypothetical protein